MKKAFTLAEIMIVLSVIAVLTAILLPAARNAMPNEDVMKFKKAHSTLTTAIRELVNSDKYYLDGDMTKKPDGSEPDCCYHAHAFADVVNAQVVSCESGKHAAGSCYDTEEKIEDFKILDNNNTAFPPYMQRVSMGKACNNQIQMQDGSIIFYSPSATTGGIGGCLDSNGFNAVYGEAIITQAFNMDVDGNGVINSNDAKMTLRACGGLSDGECPETKSYLIRKDGRMIFSSKVDEWLLRDIQDKD